MSSVDLSPSATAISRWIKAIIVSGWMGLAGGSSWPAHAATYQWQGGDGAWNGTEWPWSSSEGPMIWSDGHLARFGGSSDTIGGGVITLDRQAMQVAGLHFSQRVNQDLWYVIKSDTSLNGGTPFTVNLTHADITLDSTGYGEFQNVLLQRSGSLNIKGSNGGTLVLGTGTQLHTTGYSNLIGGATVVVKAGAEWIAGDSFLVGTTVTNHTSGDAHLVIDGGTVASGTLTGSRNFILGNRNNRAGNVSVTMNSGELRVHSDASTGLSFENIDQQVGETWVPTNAVFNLNGGLLTARRIIASNNTGNANARITGETRFNFNGGTWKIVNPFGDQNITLADRVKYVIKEGGAILDTNGFDVLSRANFYTDETLVGRVDGGLTKLGAGKLTLAADNYFTGDLSIRGGGVIAFTDARLGDARKIQIHNGASLENTTMSYEMRASRGVELGGDATWTVNGSTTTIFKGSISNISGQTGRLVKKGNGTLDLRDGAQSSYTGGISILGGSLLTNAIRQLGSSSSVITIDGGTFVHHTTEVVSNNFVIGANGAKIGGNAWNGRGIFTGSGQLQVQGTVVLGGKNVDLSSHIEVLEWGNLGLRQASAMGNATGGITLRNNAILRLDHNGVGGSGYDVQDRFYKDALVMQSGSQLWTLGRNSGNDSAATAAIYQGAITLQGGNLVRMHVFNQNGSFSQAEVPDLEITSTISGAGGLEKTGAGRLVLSAQNTFTGKVQISAGEVEVRHAQALSTSGWVQVNAATTLNVSSLPQWSLQQTLSGEGTVLGHVVVGQTGQIRPGNNDATQTAALAGEQLGKLIIDGDLTLANTTVNAMRLQLGEMGSDQVQVLGQLVVDEGVKIEVVWAEGSQAGALESYDLLDWTGVAQWGSFDIAEQLLLPSLHFLPGSSWDTSQFLSQGILRVVPEPSRVMLLGSAGLGLLMVRRRKAKAAS